MADVSDQGPDEGSNEWVGILLAMSVGAVAEFGPTQLADPSRFWRWAEAALGLAFFYGAFWLIGATGNLLVKRPWRAPKPATLAVGIACVAILSVYINFHPGYAQSGTTRAAAPLQPTVAPPGLKPYDGPVIANCPDEQRRVGAECVERAPLYVRRDALGDCPTGYVDHPTSPEMCALPAAAARMLRGN